MPGSSSRTLRMVLTALTAVLIALCSWITVPGPVPFTLQTFGVFTATALLGGKRATGAVLLYMLLGAIGLPVFSGFQSGVGVLFGPTGGYIWGFVALALLYWLLTRLFGNGTLVSVLAMLLGLLACYAVGTAQFLLVMRQGGSPYTLGAALWLCVLPFIPADLAKLALALFLARRLSRAVSLPGD